MAVVTVEIPEPILAKPKRADRPPQEIIVQVLEDALETGLLDRLNEPSREELIRQLLVSGFVRNPDEYDSPDVQAWLAMPEQERDRILADEDQRP